MLNAFEEVLDQRDGGEILLIGNGWRGKLREGESRPALPRLRLVGGPSPASTPAFFRIGEEHQARETTGKAEYPDEEPAEERAGEHRGLADMCVRGRPRVREIG